MELNQEIAKYWVGGDDKPPRKAQIEALNWLVENKHKKYLFLEAPVGCHQKNTDILMYDGTFKKVQNIVIGDQLMGPDSEPRNVLRLVSGDDVMYRVTPTKGDSFVVNQHHVLSLKTTPTGKGGFQHNNDVVNISVKDFLQKSDYFKNNIKLYRTNALSFRETCQSSTIDPYFLGILLGDGTLHNGVGVTTIDEEIKEVVYDEALKYNLQVRINEKTDTDAVTLYLTSGYLGGRSDKNQLINELQELDLYGTKCHDKFIPHVYKTASIKSRRSLLGGLIDSDGHLSTGCIEIVSKSERLLDDIIFICRSLGLAAYKSIKIVNDVNYFRVSISGDMENIPSVLIRKTQTKRSQKKRVTVTGFSLTELTIDRYYGFTVDSDNLYVMGDFTVTHNCGKSMVGMTFSRYMKNHAYALTPQVILQHQYENDFESDKTLNMASLYGKANYACTEKHGLSCAVGSVIKPRCSNCPYSNARDAAISANNTVMNYKMALSAWKYTKIFKKDDEPVVRKLSICDEGHTLENHLVGFDSIQITDKWCTDDLLQMPNKNTRDIKVMVDFLRSDYYASLIEAYDHLLTEVELMKGTEDARMVAKKTKELKFIESQINTCTSILKASMDDIDRDYVMVETQFGVELKRLYGHYSFKNIMEPTARQFLFMSSTFLGKKECCDELGLNPDDVAYISIDSEFDPDNRPVVFMPRMKMNYKWKDDFNKKNRKKMLDTIVEIAKMHEGENGIIHTGNFAIAEWLVENLSTKTHELVHHNPGTEMNRNEAITYFLDESTTPAILISPSSTEGLDLKYDLGGFAIFAKIPFGNMGDAWIKKRMTISNEWYQRRAIIDIIQGCGRIVRTPDDEGTTYILDESFGYLYNQNKKIIPQWWKDAYHEV